MFFKIKIIQKYNIILIIKQKMKNAKKLKYSASGKLMYYVRVFYFIQYYIQINIIIIGQGRKIARNIIKVKK